MFYSQDTCALCHYFSYMEQAIEWGRHANSNCPPKCYRIFYDHGQSASIYSDVNIIANIRTNTVLLVFSKKTKIVKEHVAILYV